MKCSKFTNDIKQKGKFFKNNRGAITLYVVTALTFMLILLLSVQAVLNNKKTSGEREYQRIKESYQSVDANEAYIKKIGFQEEETESLLPDGYTQLAYIESTGTQYIDTGINSTSNIGIYCEFLEEQTQVSGGLFGNFGQGRAYYYGFSQWNGVFETFYGTQSNDITRPQCVINTKYEIYFNYLNDKKLILNNTVINDSLSTILDSDYNIWIYKINNGGTTYNYYTSSNTRIYRCKITDNDLLVRDYIPCKTTKQVTDVEGNPCAIGTVGLYDLVGGKFYKNKATSGVDFTPGPEVVQLPKGYKQLEYIESTGTQYIDTKYIANVNTELDIEYQFTQAPSNFQAVIFNGQSGTTYSGIGIYAYNDKIRYEIGDFRVEESSNDLTRKKIYISKDTIKVNNVTTNREGNLTYIKPGAEKGISVFGATWSNTSYVYYVCTKVYGLKIMENGSLYRNFIPCKTTKQVTDVEGNPCAIGTVGLYDTANGKFYTNKATSGDDFTPGPEI